MTKFEERRKARRKEWNVYSQNLCAFGKEAKDKKHVHSYFDTEQEAIDLAKKFNRSCTDSNFFKVEKTIF